MAKKPKTPEEKARAQFEDMTFTTVDGRELKMTDHFRPDDFAVGDKVDDVFIKHIGLVRILKELFVVKARSAKVMQVPQKDNEWCATVEVQYLVIPKYKTGEEPSGPPIEYLWTAVADCRVSNAMQGFNKYTTTNAETRASGRAIRALLGIDFCTMEEIAEQTHEVAVDNSPAQPQQLMVLEKRFMTQCGITLDQMRKLLKKSEEELPTLEDLTRAEASDLIMKLNKNADKLVEQNETKKTPKDKETK